MASASSKRPFSVFSLLTDRGGTHCTHGGNNARHKCGVASGLANSPGDGARGGEAGTKGKGGEGEGVNMHIGGWYAVTV